MTVRPRGTDRVSAIARTRTDTRLLEREVQAINRFPDQNPHPVMRVTRDGVLSYANPPAAPSSTR